MKLKKTTTLAAATLALASSAFALENATLTVSKIKDLNIRMYGYVETDFIADTTQGFTEEMDNNLVPMRASVGGTKNNFAGSNHRTEMSVRNSRLGFDLNLPKTDSGLQTEAVFELDFLGNNAENQQPGATTGVQTERDFFNNPAVRVRHAFVSLTKDAWNAKIGQTWSLLGWQPYYFPGEVIVQPGPGQLYRRFVQARLTNTMTVMNDWTVESAADIAKPAEMNSGNPEAHAGIRLASTKWKAASIGGSGTSMVGLSAALSGAVIPTRTNGLGNPTGTALAADVAIPLIPSKDGSDKGNNLMLMGEGVQGTGIGGLELAGLTFGVPGVSAATAGSAIDSGIAGLDASGSNIELIKARAFRSHIQYVLPGGKVALSAGYAQVEAMNLDRFAAGAAALGLAPKIQWGYVSAFYDPNSWLRFGAEANQDRDTYNDAANRHATNNRYQLTAFFLF